MASTEVLLVSLASKVRSFERESGYERRMVVGASVFEEVVREGECCYLGIAWCSVALLLVLIDAKVG